MNAFNYQRLESPRYNFERIVEGSPTPSSMNPKERLRESVARSGNASNERKSNNRQRGPSTNSSVKLKLSTERGSPLRDEKGI